MFKRITPRIDFWRKYRDLSQKWQGSLDTTSTEWMSEIFLLNFFHNPFCSFLDRVELFANLVDKETAAPQLELWICQSLSKKLHEAFVRLSPAWYRKDFSRFGSFCGSRREEETFSVVFLVSLSTRQWQREKRFILMAYTSMNQMTINKNCQDVCVYSLVLKVMGFIFHWGNWQHVSRFRDMIESSRYKDVEA